MLEKCVEGLEKMKSMGARSEWENLLLEVIKAEGYQSFTQKIVEKLALEGFMLETENLPTNLQELFIKSDSPSIQGLHSPTTLLKKQAVNIRPEDLNQNEIEELVSITSLSQNAPEFQHEIKVIKRLKILIQAEYRSFNKFNRFLDTLAMLKKKEIQLAKSQFKKVEADMNAFKSIRNRTWKQVLHKLDPTLPA
jgi:hypothetical protein